jgi:broad specificity phosphatase PhoE
VTVFLVRHGETEWSRTGRHTGRTDVPLDDEGRAQAAAVGPRLAGIAWAAVWSSPLSRARDTCRLAGLSPLLDDDLLEWDYGEYEGWTTESIVAERPGWSMWVDGYPGGEDAAAVGARVDRVIDRCRAIDGPVALFAHGHVLRVLGARWIGLSPDRGGALSLSTAAVCQLGAEHGNPVIDGWNDTSHLRNLR